MPCVGMVVMQRRDILDFPAKLALKRQHHLLKKRLHREIPAGILSERIGAIHQLEKAGAFGRFVNKLIRIRFVLCSVSGEKFPCFSNVFPVRTMADVSDMRLCAPPWTGISTKLEFEDSHSE